MSETIQENQQRSKLRRARYLDFQEFRAGLSEEQLFRIADSTILFVYPVVGQNEFELAEHPISQRILIAMMKEMGCKVDCEVAEVSKGRINVIPKGKESADFDFVVIHPMIGSIDSLPALVAEYRDRICNAKIIVQTSDQNQHEKLIGGPRAMEIAEKLLADIPGIDRVIVGFAEYPLLMHLLGRDTNSSIGPDGRGGEPGYLFRYASLPQAVTTEDLGSRSKALRVQRARGCLSPCTYCIEGQANRTVAGELSWEGLPIEEFVDQLEKIAEHGFFFINITDSSFEDPGPRGMRDLNRFCELLIARGIRLSFKIHLRAENALKATDDELDKWKRAGIDVIVCGLESGSQVELDMYRKIATKEISREAFQHLENGERFCNILGYMMFGPISTVEILREKVEFLNDIRRGWDFLNLTNRLLVFWGTEVHQQLIEQGLIDPDEVYLGFVPYRFLDSKVAELDAVVNTIKQDRPEFMRLNNLIYDAMNLKSRMKNENNRSYLSLAGKDFDVFSNQLEQRKMRLSENYCASFMELIQDPTSSFLPDFSPQDEYEKQLKEIRQCLRFTESLETPPETLYLHTWLSVVNKMGVSNS